MVAQKNFFSEQQLPKTSFSLEEEQKKLVALRQLLDHHKALLEELRLEVDSIFGEENDLPMEALTQEQTEQLAQFERELAEISSAFMPKSSVRPLRVRRQMI